MLISQVYPQILLSTFLPQLEIPRRPVVSILARSASGIGGWSGSTARRLVGSIRI